MPPRRKRDDEDEFKETSKWVYIGFLVLICGSGLPVILPLIDAVLDFFGSTGFKHFNPNDENLAQVFFGGDPWVVFCRDDNSLPNLWTAVAKKHLQSEDANLFSFGALDCRAPLKSGKNTYERFKLNSPGRPHALFCANGARPVLLPWDWNVEDPKQVEIQSILTDIKAKSRPISRIVSTTSALSDYCTSHRWCALALYNSSLDTASQQTLDTLMQSYRLVKWVRLDLAKRFLSLEKSLPALVDAPPNEPRLIVFKRSSEPNMKGLSAKAHKGLFSLGELKEFIDGCLTPSDGGAALVPLKRQPYIVKREAQKDSKPKKVKNPDPQQNPKQSSTRVTDEQVQQEEEHNEELEDAAGEIVDLDGAEQDIDLE